MIKSLDQIFSLCGYPGFIHSDRGAEFLSEDVEEYLRVRGIGHSKTTPYHPTGNAQVERYNGVVWKSIQLLLKTYDLPISHWETVISKAQICYKSIAAVVFVY